MPPTEKRDAELAALLEEVRSLKRDLDVLKHNPIVSEAVGAALAQARDAARRDLGAAREFPPTYAVAVRTRDLKGDIASLAKTFEFPPTYAVAVRPRPDREEIVRPQERAANVRSTARPAAKATGAAARRTAKTRKPGT